MFGQIWTIARNTFTESIRQPVFTVMLIGVGLLMVLNPAISTYTLDDDNKLLSDLGLSTLFLGGLLLACFSAAGVLSREIQNKTVLTVISKPIGRPAFIVGKYVGVIASLGVAYWSWAILFLLTLRHRVMSAASDPYDMPVILFGAAAVLLALVIAVWGNYFYGWVFTSTFGGLVAAALSVALVMVLLISKEWKFQSIATEFAHEGRFENGQIMLAILMVFEGLGIVAAIAVACSTRLGQVMTLGICAATFLLGLASESIFHKHVETNLAARLLYTIVPNLQWTWLADALSQENPITLELIGLKTVYILLYIAAVLCAAAALFQRRETG